MTSLPEPKSDFLRQQAEALSGHPVSAITPLQGGDNNRVFHVECQDNEQFLLKSYFRHTDDKRDRLGTETSALAFLRNKQAMAVPKVLAQNADTGLALYEWIEGETVSPATDQDIEAALALVSRLRELRSEPGADALPLASEACFSAAEVFRQVVTRLQRLKACAAENPDLSEFLNNEFSPVLDEVTARVQEGYRKTGLIIESDIRLENRTLSPSDFGFHNALRVSGGGIVFVDFEYFGWDDPVKLTSDFLLHPGMSLTAGQKARFRDGAGDIFGSDASYKDRLELLMPIFGLRWCMIILNEFLPQGLARRKFAKSRTVAHDSCEQQFKKSRDKLKAIVENLDGDAV